MSEKTESAKSERQSLTVTEKIASDVPSESTPDMKVTSVEAFEGPEKLLEVWFLKPEDLEKPKVTMNGTGKHKETKHGKKKKR